MKLPANIDYWHTLETLPYLIAELPKHIQIELGGTPSYVCKQRGVDGRARYSYLTGECYFIIGTHVLKKDKSYQIYVVAHEIAHIINFKRNGRNQDNHGPKFHEIFKEICPKPFQHYELEYMKRFANRIDLEDMI
jgi:predicted SprT family Zn-dependent metalloprotease